MILRYTASKSWPIHCLFISKNPHVNCHMNPMLCLTIPWSELPPNTHLGHDENTMTRLMFVNGAEIGVTDGSWEGEELNYMNERALILLFTRRSFDGLHPRNELLSRPLVKSREWQPPRGFSIFIISFLLTSRGENGDGREKERNFFSAVIVGSCNV